MAEAVKPRTPAQIAKRKRKNAKRKLARQLCAAGRALPPVTGLSRVDFMRLTGGSAEEYDAYAEKFIAGAKKARRRWEFPLEPLAGVVVPASPRKRSGDFSVK